jgi:hypothetical protein
VDTTILTQTTGQNQTPSPKPSRTSQTRIRRGRFGVDMVAAGEIAANMPLGMLFLIEAAKSAWPALCHPGSRFEYMMRFHVPAGTAITADDIRTLKTLLVAGEIAKANAQALVACAHACASETPTLTPDDEPGDPGSL